MKNNFRNIFRILVLSAAALFASSVHVHAQYTLGTAIPGGTNNVPAATTNSTAIIIPVTRSTDVALQPSFKLTGSGTSAVVFKFDESLDAATWKPAVISVSVTASGTSTVMALSSSTIDAVGYLRLSSIENPNATAVTNLVLKYATKRPQ
jgi:hypothetical protein